MLQLSNVNKDRVSIDSIDYVSIDTSLYKH